VNENIICVQSSINQSQPYGNLVCYSHVFVASINLYLHLLMEQWWRVNATWLVGLGAEDRVEQRLDLRNGHFDIAESRSGLTQSDQLIEPC
jgi:hypothetical protein